MSKVTMPRAVGHVTRDTSQADMDAELPEGTLLITTTQADAYAYARVQETLETLYVILASNSNAASRRFHESGNVYDEGRRIAYDQAAAEVRAFIK